MIVRKASAEKLEQFAMRVLEAQGMPREDAAITAGVLVETSLRGVDTHGIALLSWCVDRLRAGGINPRPKLQILVDTPSARLLDADSGEGHLVSVRAMQQCIEKGREVGVAVVAVRNSNHFGAAASYSIMALPRDMIGFATTNTGRNLVPFGGREAIIGNNPQSFAIPAGKAWPLVLDMAHSVVAEGKATLAALRGERIPFGWALDGEGRPTDDPDQVRRYHLTLPVGGPKGFGLAMVMEILAGVLPGAIFGKQTPLEYELSEHEHCGHLFAALDIATFMPVDAFKAKVDQLVGYVKSAARAEGVEAIYAPGELEFLAKEERLRNGIPMEEWMWNRLTGLAEGIGVPLDVLF